MLVQVIHRRLASPEPQTRWNGSHGAVTRGIAADDRERCTPSRVPHNPKGPFLHQLPIGPIHEKRKLRTLWAAAIPEVQVRSFSPSGKLLMPVPFFADGYRANKAAVRPSAGDYRLCEQAFSDGGVIDG